jgi:HK97 family phage portal protein
VGILGKAFRAHPSNITNPKLYALDYGSNTYTGHEVDENSALESASVWAAVRKISQSIASLPLHLYKRMDRGREKAIDHPLYNLMHIRPNEIMSGMQYRETIMRHLLMWGNSYSEKDINGAGRVISLWPLDPSRMTFTRVSGASFYVYRLQNGKEIVFPARKILHVVGPSGDGLIGRDVLKTCKQSIGLTLGLEKFAGKFFGNAARPSAVLEHPEELSEEAQKRLRESFEEAYQGLDNAHRVAILEEGMKFREFGTDAEKNQVLQSRQFAIEDICRVFDIQPNKIHHLEKMTWKNVEEANIDYVVDTLTPWLCRLEQAYTLQLLYEREYEEYYFKHVVAGLLRGDIEKRWESYKHGLMYGVYSINDVRELEEMNPIDGGDTHFVQLNTIPLDTALNPPEPIQQMQQEEQPRNLEMRSARAIEGRNRLVGSFQRLFLEAGQTIVRREVIAGKKAVKKHLGQRNVQGFNGWLDEFYGDLPSHVERSFLPILKTYRDAVEEQIRGEIGAEITMTPELEQFVNTYLGTYTKRHITSSIRQLQALLRDTDPADLEAVINQRLDEWDEKRPDKIAKRESRQFLNGLGGAMILAGGFTLVWRTQGKSCPYCQMLDGVTIRKGGYFAYKGDLKPEGQPAFYVKNNRRNPPLHHGCDCMALMA